MPPDTLLHVVYAGRGDALIVEDTVAGSRNVYLVDGGPLGYSPQRQSGAPYWLYYCAALAELASGGDPPTISPQGVVVSHAHEDHYGGIEGIFKHFLAASGHREGDKDFVFSGPLVTQALSETTDMGVRDLKALLTGHGFAATDKPRPRAQTLLDAFAFSRGWLFERDVPVLPAREWSVDTSRANLASVLMRHRATGMVFTGDSAGYLVAGFLGTPPPIPQNQQIPIFKVPHHGSLRNSQRGQKLGKVPTVAWRLYGLLCIGSPSTDWNELRMPRALQQNGAAAYARILLQSTCGELGLDFAVFLGRLRTAYQRTLAEIAAGAPNPFVYEAGLRIDVHNAWKAVFAKLGKHQYKLRSAGEPVAKKLKVDPPQAPPPLEASWFAKAGPGEFRDALFGALALRELKSFFTEVNARNHVISADGNHRHPAAETLAGIALAGRPARVLVTDAYSVDFSRLRELVPSGTALPEIRYLGRGARMVLDPRQPEDINLLDPRKTTRQLVLSIGAKELHDQFQRNRGATIKPRAITATPIEIRIEEELTYLNVDAGGNVSVTDSVQCFYVDQAWMLSFGRPYPPFFPTSFDDIQVRPANGAPALCFTLLRPPKGKRRNSVLSIRRKIFEPRTYVCTGPGFLTDKLDEAAVFEFSADEAAAAAERAEGEVSLRAFCEAVGVPTDQPLSGKEALTQLVGPDDRKTLDAQILNELVEGTLDWKASLDDSTVTFAEDPFGPLVTAANLEIEPGADRDFTINAQKESIGSAAVTLARPAEGPALTMGVSVTSEAGTLVWDGAEDAEPERTRPLDQYLFELGVDSVSRPNLTVGTLLTAILGDEPQAEGLLLSAPSPIVAAGIGEWLLDHDASKVATQLTTTGGYVEIRSARVAVEGPSGGVPQEVEGLGLSYSKIALAVSDARLPAQEVALEAVATVGTTPLQARAVLSEDDSSIALSLPGGTLAGLLALLPPAAAGVEAMKVPLAERPLGALTSSAPSARVRQPSIGAEPFELGDVAATVEFDEWRGALPPGWPAPPPGTGTPTARVLSPLDAEHRAVGLDVAFAVRLGGADVPARLRAEPLPGPAAAPSWAHTLSAYPDPLVTALPATEVLGAVGLGPAAEALPRQLPALEPLLPRLAVSALTLTLASPSSGSAALRADLGLVGIDDWELMPGIALDLTTVSLTYEDGSWSAALAGEARIGETNAVAVSGQLPTIDLPGAVSFENANAELTVAALASLCKLGDLGQVPILGGLLTDTVDEVELMLPRAPGAGLAGAGFSLGIEPLGVGVLDLDWAAIEVQRRLLDEKGPSPSTAYWLEAQWGEKIVASLLFDDAADAEHLNGELRPIATTPLGEVLTGLLKTEAESTLLPAVRALPIAAGQLVQRVADFGLLSAEVGLRAEAGLPVAAATAGTLTARWVGAHKKGEEEVPEAYVLDGRLSRKDCEHEAAIEIGFRGDDEARRATGRIAAIPAEEGKEPQKLTAAMLLDLLDLKRPEVLTPKDAPDLFAHEVTSATATFSVEPFQLETLTVVVSTEETLSLLPAPAPIDLHRLTLRIEYERQGNPTTRGAIGGELPLEPKPVALTYTEPQGEEAAFRSTGSEPRKREDAPEYRRLIGADPYDPGYKLPDGLEIPAAIPMTTLSAVAKPGAYVELSGHDQGTIWPARIERLTLEVGGLGGRVRVTPGPNPGDRHGFEVSLYGRLSYRGFVGSDARFTWGPGETHSLLTASATEKPADIDLAAVANSLSTPWDELVPAKTPRLSFTSAWTYTDFTAGSLDLYGEGSLGTVAGRAALLSTLVKGVCRYAFLFGAKAGAPFPLAPLWPELGAIVDGYLSLGKGNVGVLTDAEPGADVDADRSTVAADAKRQGIAYVPPLADLPPLGDELPAGTELLPGTSVVAAVDGAGAGALSKALDRIADPATTLPLLLVWGLVDHGSPRLSAFKVKLDGLTLLGGGLSIEGVADYLPSQSQALVAEATAKAPIGGEKPHDFPGRLRIGAEEAAFDSTAGKADPISAPLGLVGLSLREPRLTATYRYPPGQPTSAELRIAGPVETAAGKRLSQSGAIEYLAGAPVVAVFEMTEALAAKDIHAYGMTPAAWPAGYPSFPIESPRVYSAPEAVTVNGQPYLKGYHAVGNARFFDHPFPLDVTIDEGGLRANGASPTAIDLAYLVLDSPAVNVDTTAAQPGYELKGTAKVFGAGFGALGFAFKPADPAGPGWYGDATYAGELVGVPNPTVKFSYREGEAPGDEGLRLREWPLRPKLDDEQLDWEEALEEASKETECGALEDLGLDDEENEDKEIETVFDLMMRQTGALEADALPVVLTGTYTVIVTSEGKKTETKMEFPEAACSIPAASTFQLAQLEPWLVETLEARQEELGRSLLEGEDEAGERGLEKFMSEFDLSEASDQLLERLLCNEDDSENVREEVEERIEKTLTDTRKEWEKAKEESKSSEEAKTISSAGGSAIGGGCAITIGIGWLTAIGGAGFLGGLFGMAKLWLPIVLVEEWEELVEEEREDAEAAVTAAAKRVEDELLPMHGTPKFEFIEATAVEVSWDEANLPSHPGIDYEGFKDFEFEVEVSTDPQFANVVGTATVPGTARTATVSADPLARSNNAYARLRAVLFPLTPIRGPWISGSAFHRVVLPAPVTVSQRLEANGGQIAVTVATVPSAERYLVELLDTLSGNTLATKSVTSPTPTPATVGTYFEPDDLPPQPPGQPPLRLAARARAVGDPSLYEDSPVASAPESEAIATAGPPKVNMPVLVADGVQVTWEQVDGAGAYPVRVLDDSGKPLPQQPEITPTGLGCLLSGPGIVEGASLQVEVRALAPDALGLWCLPVPFTVRVLPAPDGLRALYLSPENVIEARWDEVSPASTYEVGVSDGEGRPLAPTVAIDGNAATISGAGIAPDRSYRLRVRAIEPGYVSTWSAWLPLSTAVAPAPSELSLRYAHGLLIATWTAVAGASGYRAALEREGTGIADVEVTAPPAEFGAATGTPLAPSTDYTVAVRARVGTSVGPAATAGTTTPSLLEIAIASWAAAVPADATALECLALEQGLGAAQLWDTLLGAGYTASEASAGVLAALPKTTGPQLETIGVAVGNRSKAIGLLTGEKVEGRVTVGLCRALYSPVPVQLAVLLKAAGAPSTGLATAFAKWFPMSLPEAEAMIVAVYSEPWRFGPVVKAEGQSAADAVALLRIASPGIPAAAILAALKAAPYTEGELREVFGVPSGSGWPPWAATRVDASGQALADLLRQGGTSREAASDYVPTAWPHLTAAEVKRDIDNAYGPQ